MSTSNLEKGYGAIASDTEAKPTKSSWRRTLVALAAASVVVVGATAAYSAHSAPKTPKQMELKGELRSWFCGLIDEWFKVDTCLPIGPYKNTCNCKDACDDCGWDTSTDVLRCMCCPSADGVSCDEDHEEKDIDTAIDTAASCTFGLLTPFLVETEKVDGKPKFTCRKAEIFGSDSQYWTP